MLTNISLDIVSFLRHHHVAVLATANRSSATPHAATIFYVTDSRMNLYFLTKEHTAKSKNLDSNPQAALAVYEASTLKTAQISGQVSRVNNQQMMDRALKIMSRFSKQVSGTETTPISKLDAGAYVLYQLTPQSIRLGDYKYGVHNLIFEAAVPAEEQLENF